MRSLQASEIYWVCGGDAAATRPPGTNSWGEYAGSTVTSACTTVTFGPLTRTDCINSDGTTSTSLCAQLGIGAASPIGGIGASASICETKTSPASPLGFSLPGGDLFRALVV
jgi:hypothetical protein